MVRGHTYDADEGDEGGKVLGLHHGREVSSHSRVSKKQSVIVLHMNGET